eukprot:g701.t1
MPHTDTNPQVGTTPKTDTTNPQTSLLKQLLKTEQARRRRAEKDVNKLQKKAAKLRKEMQSQAQVFLVQAQSEPADDCSGRSFESETESDGEFGRSDHADRSGRSFESETESDGEFRFRRLNRHRTKKGKTKKPQQAKEEASDEENKKRALDPYSFEASTKTATKKAKKTQPKPKTKLKPTSAQMTRPAATKRFSERDTSFRGQRNDYTEQEVAALRKGVFRFGKGAWKQILCAYRATFHACRSSQCLKDKWRNLQRSSSQQ